MRHHDEIVSSPIDFDHKTRQSVLYKATSHFGERWNPGNVNIMYQPSKEHAIGNTTVKATTSTALSALLSMPISILGAMVTTAIYRGSVT